MRKVWAIIGLVAALSLPSFAAAMVLPPAGGEAAYVKVITKKPATPGDCKPTIIGQPSPCVPIKK
jgi:hypothetical protein